MVEQPEPSSAVRRANGRTDLMSFFIFISPCLSAGPVAVTPDLRGPGRIDAQGEDAEKAVDEGVLCLKLNGGAIAADLLDVDVLFTDQAPEKEGLAVLIG